MTFETAWEAFTERAGIMEFDGGLSRRAAVLKAFELYFPGDFRECMKAAGQDEAGETMLYDYLESLLREGVKTLRNSPIEAQQRAAGAQTIKQHHTAPDRALQGRYEATRRGDEKGNGLEGLKEYINKRKPA
jgi:hypothetical protein